MTTDNSNPWHVSVSSENEAISDYRQAVSKEEIAEIVRELGLKETDMAAKEMAEEVLNYTNLETEIKLIYKPWKQNF